MRKLLILLAAGLALAGCGNSPLGPNERQLLSAVTPVYAPGNPPNPWYLYDDSLETANPWLKGLDFYSGSFTGLPVIDLACTVSPYRGTDCMHFGIGAQSGGWYCGMILLQANNFTNSNSNPGVDITPGHYTKCVFMARVGQGTSPVSFTAGNPVTAGDNTIMPTLTTSWQLCTIAMTDTGNFTQIRQFFAIGLSNNLIYPATPALASASPVDVYIDDLRYEQ